MRISDWSSDVCSSDLEIFGVIPVRKRHSSSNEHHRGESGEGTTHIPVSDAAKPLHGETRRCQVTRKGFELTLVVRRVHPSLGEYFPSFLPRETVHSRARSEERRVGKACVRKFRSRWSPYH